MNEYKNLAIDLIQDQAHLLMRKKHYRKPRTQTRIGLEDICFLMKERKMLAADYMFLKKHFLDTERIEFCEICRWHRPAEEFDFDNGFCKWCGDHSYDGEPA